MCINLSGKKFVHINIRLLLGSHSFPFKMLFLLLFTAIHLYHSFYPRKSGTRICVFVCVPFFAKLWITGNQLMIRGKCMNVRVPNFVYTRVWVAPFRRLCAIAFPQIICLQFNILDSFFLCLVVSYIPHKLFRCGSNDWKPGEENAFRFINFLLIHFALFFSQFSFYFYSTYVDILSLKIKLSSRSCFFLFSPFLQTKTYIFYAFCKIKCKNNWAFGAHILPGGTTRVFFSIKGSIPSFFFWHQKQLISIVSRGD
jgi:hypothetical protein